MSVNYIDKSTGDLIRVAGGVLYADAPIGSIISYGGTTAPVGFLLCQGQAVSRTTYAELFAVIGTSFGSGDGSTTFNVPDLREATTKGVGLTSKSSSHYSSTGISLGGFIDDRVQDHYHNPSNISIGVGTYLGSSNGANEGSNPVSSTVAGARTGVTTEVKAVGVNYIIKAKMSAVPADFMSKVDEAVEEAVEEARQLDAPVPAVITNDFTATADGFVCFRTTPSPGGSSGKITIDVYRNGVKITNFFFVYLAGSGSSETYPCNKGDNFKINTSIECVMLPYK